MKQHPSIVARLAAAGTLLAVIASVQAGLRAEEKKDGQEQASLQASMPIAPGPFQPAWDSLKQYNCPEWFRDAKFGIWAHWSAQCVPEHGDWYARGMYEQGSSHYNYHLEHYGHPSQFGFKDICHLWKAEKWEPEKLIELYKRAGARYFVALANHHCNFDCWDSKYQPWNSVNIGPKKDIVGIWAETARKQGLRFGVTVHCARSWDWYDVAHGSDKTGPLAGVPYDGILTKADGVGKWWEGYDPQDLYCAHNKTPEARQAYLQKWFNRTKDLIDSYHPDLLYFDDGGAPLGDVGMRIFAHYYNASLQWNAGKMDVVLNTKGMPRDLLGCLVLDIERGRSDRLEGNPWQTDTCIGEWHYHRGIHYATAQQVIHQLVDIVSKNGNLLLNIPVRGDGTIDDDEVKFLEEMAQWMGVNGEAIYGTRPWLIFGESKGRLGGRSKSLGAQDIRFTAKGDVLYAIAMGWPADGQITIRALAKLPETAGKVTGVTLLGHQGELRWTHDEKGLSISLPAEKPCEHAFAFRITGEKLREFKPELALQSATAPAEPDAQGNLTLEAADAELHGSEIQVEQRGDRANIGFWDTAGDWASWKINVPQPAAYNVTMQTAAQVGESELTVEVAGQELSAKIPQTKSWDDYTAVSVGKVEIKTPGEFVVKVRPRSAQTWRPVNLLFLRLSK